MNIIFVLLNGFYSMILHWADMPEMASITNEWIDGMFMKPFGILVLALYLIMLNLFHHPGKYKYRLFFLPPIYQLAFRQVLFVTIILNPVVYITVFVYLVSKRILIWKFFNPNVGGDRSPLSLFLG